MLQRFRGRKRREFDDGDDGGVDSTMTKAFRAPDFKGRPEPVAGVPPVRLPDFHEIDRLTRIITHDLVRRGLIVLPQHVRAEVARALGDGATLPRTMLVSAAVRVDPLDYYMDARPEGGCGCCDIERIAR